MKYAEDAYCHWGLTGTPERLKMLRRIEELYAADNQTVIERMYYMAKRWPEELEELNIEANENVVKVFPNYILMLCDDSELEEILSGLQH